jgi:hypothetical protein
VFQSRTLRRGPQILAILGLLQLAIIVYPDPLFANAYASGTLTIHSDEPIDAAGAHAALASARARLASSPFPLDGARYHLYVANSAWRRRLLFLWAPDAGGVVYPMFAARNSFYSGADFRTGQLRSPSGRLVPMTRSFAYFAAHELAHLVEARRSGMRHHLRPEWVREGVADYAALGPADDLAGMRHAFKGRQLTVADWDAHGYYVRYRMLVTHYLDYEGWTLDQLLATNLSEAEAEAAMDARLAKGV